MKGEACAKTALYDQVGACILRTAQEHVVVYLHGTAEGDIAGEILDKEGDFGVELLETEILDTVAGLGAKVSQEEHVWLLSLSAEATQCLLD